ncbi:MAG: hypothetical protein JWL60_211 [Gemmatimonadetes bacterium]|jgi:hypothetical protein|nr:hypothetical protein [Gemmatimonadota bacterium]
MTSPVSFSPHFDRAVTACAQAQILLARAAAAAARSRELRAAVKKTRRLAVETRDAWKGADAINATLRRQVGTVAAAMRDAGVSHEEAAATVRAHVRFVLYDGGLREVDAEPVVARTTIWVAESYRAA